MKFKSEIVTQASGSIGGVTYAHNRGGLYRRARSIPTNPNTPRQQLARNALGALVSRFRGTLTIDQREAWDLYAANTPVTGKLGDPIVLSGLNMYVRGNQPRANAILSPVDDGPTTFGLPTFTTPEIETAEGGGGTVDIGIDNTDDWANEDGAYMFMYQGRPQSGSVNSFGGPWRLALAVAGNSVTPPVATQQPPVQWPITTGQATFWRFNIVDAQGRLSSTATVRAIVTAP